MEETFTRSGDYKIMNEDFKKMILDLIESNNVILRELLDSEYDGNGEIKVQLQENAIAYLKIELQDSL